MKEKFACLRRAPVSLAAGVIFFLLIQWTLNFLIQSWKPQPGYDPEYAHKLAELRTRLSESDHRAPLCLVFGSSRVATGFQKIPQTPGLAGNDGRIFNLGICRWVTPAAQAVVLHRVLREGIRPVRVVFEVFPAYLSTLREKQVNALDVNRLDWADLETLRPYTAAALPQQVDWIFARSVPAFSERFLLLSRYVPDWVEPDKIANFNWASLGDWGWTRLPNYNRIYGVDDGLVASYRVLLGQWHMSATSQRVYADMLKACRAQGIETTMILMPEHGRIRACYTAPGEARLHTALRDFEDRYGASVIDARDWMPDESFVEGIHLTHSGSADFTRRFENVLQPMLVSDHLKVADGGVQP